MAADVVPGLPALVLAATLGALAAGCGDAAPDGSPARPPTTTGTQAATPLPPPRPPPCPPSGNCERAAGEIVYVERVDPDGDGDAHFVLVSREGITAPGISVIDVRADLRPRPLPGPGDQLAASGPVYEGSFGQRQIQAEAIRFRRSG